MSSHMVERMVEAATLAPSLHNSQPWWFDVAPDRLEVHADLGRALPAIDPDGRWLHASCGAATLNAAVTGRAAGRQCGVSIEAGGPIGDCVATIALGDWIAPTKADLALARALPARRTNRLPFAPGRLSPVLVDELRAAAAAEGCWTHTITTRAEVAELSTLLRSAEEEQQADPEYQAELRTWVRELGSPALDGVPAEALPSGGPDRDASDVWVRDFGAGAIPVEPQPGPERPLILVLGTSADGPVSWVRAGMAMERLLLTATAAGVAGSPLTQVLEVPRYRAELRRLVGIDGVPQMALRLGWPAAVAPAARRRRPLADVVRLSAR